MSMLKRFFSALFNATLAPLLALVLIFEEWGWAPLSRFMERLAHLPLWAHVERWITRLPPHAALFLFVVPMVLLLPIKLLALYWISRGHALIGLTIILVAKLVGTAVVARLFALSQPALMQLDWFAWLYIRWIPWKNALIAKIKDTTAWRALAEIVQKLREWIRQLLYR